MIEKIIIFLFYFFIAYLVYLFSLILHEISHYRIAKKYDLELLKTKKEARLDGAKVANLSFYRGGLEIKIFGGKVHVKDGEISKLNNKQIAELMLAGIKSDIKVLFVISIGLLIHSTIRLYNHNPFGPFDFSLAVALVILIGTTYDNIHDPWNLGGDVRKLNEMIK